MDAATQDTATPTACPRLVIIEGNISAGKSTLAAQLGAALGYRVFLEPVEANPYLARFYADPKAWALPMQMWLLDHRYRTYLAALSYMYDGGGGGGGGEEASVSPVRGVILDRSVWSDWVFAEKNRQDGNIDEEGFDQYMRVRDAMLEALPLPHCTVYLEVAPERCHERIHTVRMRPEEVGRGDDVGDDGDNVSKKPTGGGGIQVAYLSGLEACYKQLLGHLTTSGAAVVKQDWNEFGDVSALAWRIRETPPVPRTMSLNLLRALIAAE